MSENGIQRPNFNFLRVLYFLQLLKFEKIKCPQNIDFPTLYVIFGHFKNFSQKFFYRNLNLG